MHDIVHHHVPFQTIELFIVAFFQHAVLYRTYGRDCLGAVMLLQTLYVLYDQRTLLLLSLLQF